MKIKIELGSTKVHFVGIYYMIMEYGIEGMVVYVHASQAEKSGWRMSCDWHFLAVLKHMIVIYKQVEFE